MQKRDFRFPPHHRAMRRTRADTGDSRVLEFYGLSGDILLRLRLWRLAHGPNEPIPPAMHRLNELRAPGIVTQSVPQFANADFQYHIRYGGLRPDGID
jgi:hypothetical protein